MRGALFLASVAAILVCLALLPARAQDSGRSIRDELHFGAGSCAAQACHGGAFHDRVEYKVWATEDKHSKAYEVLSGSLGRRMGARLGIQPTKAKRCLNCHGTTGVELAETFDMADGVSCELCHGGARGWLGPHAAPEWQKLSIAQKEERGLRDLSTPAKRAQACVRCHVGGEGSDITHAIMAAGHPPLHFDAATYLRVMPPHWEDEQDLSVPTWLESTKANAVAQLERIARRAATPNGWPEFAVFDCESCHHPAYVGTVYESQPPPGKPGDLPFELSSLKVLLVALGDETAARRFTELSDWTYTPGADVRRLDDYAREMAAEVGKLLLDTGRETPEKYLSKLDAHLQRVEAREVRVSRALMRQIGFAIFALSPGRDSSRFRKAYEELDRALAPLTKYDVAACAMLARAALAARE
jgi:hypothetical protein